MTTEDKGFQAFKSDWIKKNSMKRGKMVDAEAVENRFSVRGKYLKRYTEIQSVLKTQSYHEGKNDERADILAKVRQMKKLSGRVPAYLDFGILEGWLLKRTERYRKNPGGL